MLCFCLIHSVCYYHYYYWFTFIANNDNDNAKTTTTTPKWQRQRQNDNTISLRIITINVLYHPYHEQDMKTKRNFISYYYSVTCRTPSIERAITKEHWPGTHLNWSQWPGKHFDEALFHPPYWARDLGWWMLLFIISIIIIIKLYYIIHTESRVFTGFKNRYK